MLLLFSAPVLVDASGNQTMNLAPRVGSIRGWAHAIQLRRQACGRARADRVERIVRAAMTVAKVRIGSARITHAQVSSARPIGAVICDG